MGSRSELGGSGQIFKSSSPFSTVSSSAPCLSLPSLPFPLSFPFCPFTSFPSIQSPSLQFPTLFSPFLPLFCLITARESGERYSSPSGSGQIPAARRFFVQFTAQNLQICLKFSPTCTRHSYNIKVVVNCD